MVRSTNERLADLMTLDLPSRLAKWLLEHATHAEGNEAEFTIPFDITQSDLAVELGATRVSVNKALHSFAAERAIVIERQRIVLLRPDLLYEHIDV
jgi:CRP/FNR family transcriptional regulator, cyclic AMP receptor protein